MDVEETQKALDTMFHGFSVDVQLRMRYCTQDKPMLSRNDEGLSRIISSSYRRNMERPEISAIQGGVLPDQSSGDAAVS